MCIQARLPSGGQVPPLKVGVHDKAETHSPEAGDGNLNVGEWEHLDHLGGVLLGESSGDGSYAGDCVCGGYSANG